ncbi:MAG: 30S ribosomal protein S20 [bacterium]|nr:30S ribosomal protein S20 [bacterium]
MPITKSAEKALRQSIHRRKRNLKQKEAYKTVVREVKNLAAAGKIKEAQEKLSGAYQTLDKVAKTGFIKKNKAARLKSRLTKLVQKK